MKKIISVLLAAVMLMSCFGMVSFATEEAKCECPDGVHLKDQACHCCVNCPNIDSSYLMGCYFKTGALCCEKCDGIAPCNCGLTCGCEFCLDKDQNIADDDNTLGDVITEQDKENFVDGFQAILKRISDFFDTVFDAIFAFLRIDEVLGTTK